MLFTVGSLNSNLIWSLLKNERLRCCLLSWGCWLWLLSWARRGRSISTFNGVSSVQLLFTISKTLKKLKENSGFGQQFWTPKAGRRSIPNRYWLCPQEKRPLIFVMKGETEKFLEHLLALISGVPTRFGKNLKAEKFIHKRFLCSLSKQWNRESLVTLQLIIADLMSFLRQQDLEAKYIAKTFSQSQSLFSSKIPSPQKVASVFQRQKMRWAAAKLALTDLLVQGDRIWWFNLWPSLENFDIRKRPLIHWKVRLGWNPIQ